MSKIHVLIVDDNVVVRRLVSDALGSDPDIEVVGTAANGRIGLQKITQCNPDVVTMDIEMPELDGLGALKAIRATWPKLPVIMFSTLTERGASATMDALALGASDYVTKPSNVGSISESLAAVRRDLIPKIKALAGRSAPPPSATVANTAAPVAPARRAPISLTPGRTADVAIIAIGVSTGGPNALAVVLPGLPADLPVPVVIVQHMPPMFTRMLAERLDAQSAIHVVEAEEGMVLKAGTAYIAPGDFHMELDRQGTRTMITLNQQPPENSCRPAVDPLFRSVARQFTGSALGLILTGMGRDGLRGCELFREAGCPIVAQDEATSVVWGMPGFVARAGLADRVLPLNDIAGELSRRVPSLAHRASAGTSGHSALAAGRMS